MTKRQIEEKVDGEDPPMPAARKKARSTGSPSQGTPATKRVRGAGICSGEPPEKKPITQHGELIYPAFYPRKDDFGKKSCQGCRGPTATARPTNGYRCCIDPACRQYLGQLPPALKDSVYFRKKFRLQAEAEAIAVAAGGFVEASQDGGSTLVSRPSSPGQNADSLPNSPTAIATATPSPADITDSPPSDTAKPAEGAPSDVACPPPSDAAKPVEGAPSDVACPPPSDVAKPAKCAPADVRDPPLSDSINPVESASAGVADSDEPVEGTPTDARNPLPSDAAKPAETTVETPMKATPRAARTRRTKSEDADASCKSVVKDEPNDLDSEGGHAETTAERATPMKATPRAARTRRTKSEDADASCKSEVKDEPNNQNSEGTSAHVTDGAKAVEATNTPPSDAAKPAETAAEGVTPMKAKPRKSRSQHAISGDADAKQKKMYGYKEDEVKNVRPECGFFPPTYDPKTCQSCRTLGRYIWNGYRGCYKQWCRDHFASLPPFVNEDGVVSGQNGAKLNPDGTRRKTKYVRKSERVKTEKKTKVKTEENGKKSEVKTEDDTDNSDDESNSSASDSSSEEESSEDENSALQSDKTQVDNPSTQTAADPPASVEKTVVNGNASPTTTTTTTTTVTITAQNVRPSDPSMSPPTSPSPSPIEFPTSDDVPELSPETRNAKLEELRNLFRSMPQKTNFAQADVDKRLRYLQDKTKKNEPPFPRAHFKDIVVTAEECEELCEVMRASFREEEEKRRVAAKEQQEKEGRIAEKATKLEEARKAVEEKRKAAIQARMDEQRREELERKARRERLPSAISKRLRVVLRKGFYPVNGNNYEMTGYFHPKAELDREYIDQHDFKLIQRTIYGKERWALKFEDKDVENTPEHRDDETAFFLSRVSPMHRAQDDGVRSRDIDSEQLTVDQIVAILADASNNWKDDCMLVFREFPKPPQQQVPRIAFLVKDVISQTQAEFEMLSDAEKRSEDHKVLTTQHEVESLKSFSVLWNQTIVMTCDRCNQTVPMNSGQLQPSDREQWLRKGSRYALDTFVCQNCLNIENDALTGTDGGAHQIASSSAYQASYQASIAYEEKPTYTSYGNSNSWNSQSSNDYYQKNSKSNYGSANCQYCDKELSHWDYQLGYEHNEDYVCHEEACLLKHTWSGKIKPKLNAAHSMGFIDSAHLKKLASYIVDEKKDIFLSTEEWRKCDRSVDYDTNVTFNIIFGQDKKGVRNIRAIDVKQAWWSKKS